MFTQQEPLCSAHVQMSRWMEHYFQDFYSFSISARRQQYNWRLQNVTSLNNSNNDISQGFPAASITEQEGKQSFIIVLMLETQICSSSSEPVSQEETQPETII